jgi:alkylation response protein AidB-like acyl-CoA dehydrogenase
VEEAAVSEQPLDAGQLALDNEDLRARLAMLHRAIRAKDEADEEVARLTRELAHARRKAKEAGWEVGRLMGRERREARNGK